MNVFVPWRQGPIELDQFPRRLSAGGIVRHNPAESREFEMLSDAGHVKGAVAAPPLWRRRVGSPGHPDLAFRFQAPISNGHIIV